MSELYGSGDAAETGTDSAAVAVDGGPAEPVEPVEPEDLVGPADLSGDSGEPGEPEPLEPSAREEGAEGGILRRVFDVTSWWSTPGEGAVDRYATVDRPDLPGESLIEGVRYGTPLDGPDGERAPLFDGPPSREQTEQGSIGDCGIISTLGAVAHHFPHAISGCVQEKSDGTYEVTLHQTTSFLYGDWSRFESTGAVTVLTVTPEIPVRSDMPHVPAYGSSGASDAAWVPILEKAIAGVDATWDEARGKPAEGYTRLDLGSFPHHRAELLTQLTGETAYTDDFPTQYDMEGRSPDRQLLETFREKLADGRPLLVGTFKPELPDRMLPKGLIPGHAYEVTTVDDRGLIHLRNPHNAAHPQPLTVSEFRAGIRNRYTTIG
ncbi:C2 family cysteine protease [Streptomyces sp. NPDC055992]|uniref:C2 family cysteine protease n=1 Tax=Streptomyces sp. NPDC055992 TaxID=3345673 RepID=UPI0035DAF0DA